MALRLKLSCRNGFIEAEVEDPANLEESKAASILRSRSAPSLSKLALHADDSDDFDDPIRHERSDRAKEGLYVAELEQIWGQDRQQESYVQAFGCKAGKSGKERGYEECRQDKEFLKQKFESWQHTGRAPLPVVRCLLLGPGRAGKTTTLRHLKQESEPRTKNVVQDAETMLGPRRIDDDLLAGIGELADETQPIQPKLQYWDFAGQGDYAQSNLVHFHGRGIYLVFCDVSQPLEEAWRELQSWLWHVAQYAVDEGGRADAAPPIILVAAKWESRQLDTKVLDERLEQFLQRLPKLRHQLQPGPREFPACRSKYLWPVENTACNVERYLEPLRRQIQELALELLLPRSPHLRADEMPHAGLQSEQFPVAWLRAHDILTRLGDGMEATVPETQLLALGSSSLDRRLNIKLMSSVFMKTHKGETIVLPDGTNVQVEVLGRDDTGQSLHVMVFCTSLELSKVLEMFAVLQPRPILQEEAIEVLSWLHSFGILVWFNEEGLREHVLLDIRRVSVAMTRVISVCIWADRGLQHSADYQNQLRDAKLSQTELRRLSTEGLATRKLLKELWRNDFSPQDHDAMTSIILKIMVQKSLILNRGFVDEFIVPCCLPSATVPESPDEAAEVRYVDLDGLISPAMLSQIAVLICKKENTTHELCPGPPQVFRNHVEFASNEAITTIALSPSLSFQLLRIRVKLRPSEDPPQGEAEAEQQAQRRRDEMDRIIHSLFEVVGIALKSRDQLVWERENMRLDPEIFFAKFSCFKSHCMVFPSCPRCELSDSCLLNERFLPDLSLLLAKVVQSLCVRGDVRPSGSFRFIVMKFPGDVDVEEYVVAGQADLREALRSLAQWLQWVCKKCERQADVYWGELKAGTDPTNEEVLNWSIPEVLKGRKPCAPSDQQQTEVWLKDALAEGNKSRTALIRIFARATLLRDTSCAPKPRFFEVTNAIRFGHVQNGRIQAVTSEYDFLTVLAILLWDYCGKTPKAMKFVKRLWERAAFLAKRNIAVEACLTTLKALLPIFGHWVAELGQIAAHVETLQNMLKRELEDAVRSDVEALGQSLEAVKKRMLQAEACVWTWEPTAKTQVLATLEDLPRVTKADGMLAQTLSKAEDLLEASVELVLVNWLRSFQTPLARPLHDEWTFPSDHLPIAAKLAIKCREKTANIRLCSWKLIHRVSGSLFSEAAREMQILDNVKNMLLHPTCPKQLLCLQGCWPKLLEKIDEWLRGQGSFSMTPAHNEHRESSQKQVVIYSTDDLMLESYGPLAPDLEKDATVAQFGLRSGLGHLRVIPAHLSSEPFGPARRTLCRGLQSLPRLQEERGVEVPAFLVGDLSFTEKAIGPLLKHYGNFPDTRFVPIPYPTTICEGSLVPMRTDCIALLSPKELLQAEPLEGKDVLAGLPQHLELLRTRSLGLAGIDEHVFSRIAAADGSPQMS
ncbi:NLRC3 [Symbiodinium sp. CCMP2592]|nr:NLRC3 [Symbiodinium sp. CCMP2592]